VRRQAAAIHSSLLESRNFDGNEGMQEAVQRVQDLEKQLLDRIHVFVFFGKEKIIRKHEKGKTSQFFCRILKRISNEVCKLVKDRLFF